MQKINLQTLVQEYDSTKDNYGVVAENPELVDINYRGNKRIGHFLNADFSHLNSIDYIEEFDQLLLSFRGLNEIWIIDHSTTTEEAAGHTGGNYGKGGDILYRWGNPQVYHAGDESDQKLFAQHDARWVTSENPGTAHITIFNNGVSRPGIDYSSFEEIVPPVDENGNYYLNLVQPMALKIQYGFMVKMNIFIILLIYVVLKGYQMEIHLSTMA